jgi:hypothetical protein
MKKIICGFFIVIAFLAITNRASATHLWCGGSLSGGTKCLNTGLCFIIEIDDGCDCIIHQGRWEAWIDPTPTMQALAGQNISITWYNPDGTISSSQSGTVANASATDNGDGSWSYDITWQ